MTECFVGAILGARRGGKTTLAVDLLLGMWRYRFDMIVILSRTIPLQEEFWQRIAGTGVLLCETLDMNLLSKLKGFMEGRKGEVLLLCDDLGKLASWWARRTMSKTGNEDILTHFAYASRHYNISLLYLTQDLTQLSTGYRKNFDFVICLEASIADQQLMYVELLSNTFRGQCAAFKDYYAAHTGDFNFFVVHKEKGQYQVWPPINHGQTTRHRHVRLHSTTHPDRRQNGDGDEFADARSPRQDEATAEGTASPEHSSDADQSGCDDGW
jgi:hypothetical protein